MQQTTHPLTARPITRDQLLAIYASDQEMYPAPLSFDRLRSWVDAYPELSISFYQNEKDTTGLGVIIVLPLLKPHWEDLLVGKIKEIDIDPRTMFPSRIGNGQGERTEVGLHVFHVEKFRNLGATARGTGVVSEAKIRNHGKGFAEIAVDEAVGRAVGGSQGVVSSVWGTRTEGWKVCGLSALTATEAGRRTFSKMDFVPTGYKEMFVACGDGGGGEGTGVKMVCIYPGNKDVEEENVNSGVIVPSEMVVKYLAHV